MTETAQPQPELAPSATPPVPLSPEMTVPVAVQRIIHNQSSEFQEMLPVAYLAEDTEGVHKVRVSLRRMGTCLKVTRAYYQKSILVATRIDLKFVREVYGRVRDMDVFHQYFAQSFAEAHPNEDYNSSIWMPVFDQTYQDYLAQIRSPVTQDITQQLIKTLDEFQVSETILEDPDKLADLPPNIAAFLPIVLNAQLEEIRQYQINPDEDRQYSSHHRLRLLTKAHRYTYEFFQSVLEPEPAQMAIEALTRIQDHLGELNDSVQAIRLVSTHQSSRFSRSVSSVLADYILFLQEKQNTIIAALPEIWEEFITARPQTLLDSSIAPLKV